MIRKPMMLLAAVVGMALSARAATETVGGYTWTYRINGDTAEISSVSATLEPGRKVNFFACPLSHFHVTCDYLTV